MVENIYIQHFSYYQPPRESLKDAPPLPYVDALFKRRLSQLSRMTIEVVHGVKDAALNAKLVFASYRGEIARQVKINKGLVEDQDVLPAQFSLSVFNTPPAVATIALGLKSGYTAIYPSARSPHRFYDAFSAALSALLSGSEERILFVYGDELIPAEYEAVLTDAEKAFTPFAFAAVLGTQKTDGALLLPEALKKPDAAIRPYTPEDFLAYLQTAAEKKAPL